MHLLRSLCLPLPLKDESCCKHSSFAALRVFPAFAAAGVGSADAAGGFPVAGGAVCGSFANAIALKTNVEARIAFFILILIFPFVFVDGSVSSGHVGATFQLRLTCTPGFRMISPWFFTHLHRL
jgi:hypothetical protein